jgi:hypothetical protein
MLASRSREVSEKRTSDTASGRRLIISWGVALVVLQVLAFVGVYLEGDIRGAGMSFTRIVVLSAAFVALYYGYKWARVWISIGLALAALTSLGALVKYIQLENLALAAAACLLLAVYAVAFFYFALSERITLHMNSWRVTE